MLILFCRPSSGCILEALHIDPASGVSIEKEKNSKLLKPSVRYIFYITRYQNFWADVSYWDTISVMGLDRLYMYYLVNVHFFT